ncbi:MAG: orotidine 5'-phosphate decarboxylase [Acidobacteria bacterium]|nr:orotidine 5'-phosphate decarboxylase [Acidobacteriota bacterium]
MSATIDALRAAVEARGNASLKILAVTLLTSQDKNDLEEMGITMTVEEYVLFKTRKAEEEGHADGVIASGREAAAIRERLGKKFLIVTPGIRPAGTACHDHKRATTPAEAIRGGADYLVVGRPITRDQNPLDATNRILDEMQKAFDSLRI